MNLVKHPILILRIPDVSQCTLVIIVRQLTGTAGLAM